MRIPKKTHELIRQNEQIVKKSQKHDINLQKNSVLYFQIGLIVCLLSVYGLLEMRFETVVNPVYGMPTDEDYFADVPVEPFKPYKEVTEIIKSKPVVVKKVELTKNPVIVENADEILKALNIENPQKRDISDVPLNPDDLDDLIYTKEEVVNIVSVSQVPIYPGCEKKKTNS